MQVVVVAVVVAAIGIKDSMVLPRKLYPPPLRVPAATALPELPGSCLHSMRYRYPPELPLCKTAAAAVAEAVGPTTLQQVVALASIKKEAHQLHP